MASKRNRNISTDEDEIAIIDDVQAKNRKRRRPTKKKKEEIRIEEKRDALLVDVDLEGVPDEEKEQIRLAILASKEDENRNRHNVKEIDQEENANSEDIMEVVSVPTDETIGEMSEEDILSEVVSDPKLIQKGNMNIVEDSCETQEFNLEDLTKSEYSMPTQIDKQTHENFISNDWVEEADDEEVVLDLSRSTLVDDGDAAADDDDETQRPDSPVKYENSIDQNGSMHNQPSEGHHSQDKRSEGQQFQGQHSSSPNRSAKIDHSRGSGFRTSQGSEGFLPNVPDSDSQHSQMSYLGKDCLERHYRGVKYKVSEDPLHSCRDTMDKKEYATVISQWFDIYHRKLKQAQQQLFKNTGRLKWGESVKTGQHYEKSIDAKRRGHEVCFFNLTQANDDEDSQPETCKKDKGGKTFKISDSEDDLPELLVEKDGGGQTSGFKMTRYTAAEAADIIQQVNESDTSHSIDIGILGAGEPANPEIGAKQESVKTKMQNNRLCRKNTKGIRDTDEKVIVMDTQSYNDIDDFLVKGKKTKMETVIEETQMDNDDVKWSDVIKTRPRRDENQDKREQLKGYTIPRTNIGTDESNQSMSNNCKVYKEQKAMKANSTKRKIATLRGKVIVEETQDSDCEEPRIIKKRNKILKRNCFKINSDSEEESIPETQTNTSPDKVNDEEDAPQGIFRKIMSKVKDVTHFSKPKQEEDCPVVTKRQKSLFSDKQNAFDKTPLCKTQTDHHIESDFPPVDVMFMSRSSGRSDHKVDQRLKFSRNASKDSIQSTNSDNISVTSSQVSNTLLDDNGDLYSTQVGEMRNTKRSSKRRKAATLHAKIEPEQNSDEDIVLVGVEINDKSQSKISDGNKISRVTRNRNIDQCFGFAQEDPVMSEKRNVKTDCLEQSTSSRVDFVDDQDFDENPFPKKNRRTPLGEMKQKLTPDIGSKSGNRSSSNWNINEDFLESDDINTNKRNTREQSDMKNRTRLQNKWKDDPDFLNIQMEKDKNRKVSNQGSPSANKYTHDVLDNDTDKVEISDDVSEEEIPKPSSSSKQPQEEMVECPLCGKQYSAEIIEQHAGNCDGPVLDDERPIMEDGDLTNREEVACPICDKQISKAISERHVEECWELAAKRQAQPREEEPIQTRRGKNRNNGTEGPFEAVSPRRPLHRNRDNTRYLPETRVSCQSESTDSSCGDDDDEDFSSDSDDNVTLLSLARSVNSALITGPWNKSQQKENQSPTAQASDWSKNGSNSPIKSFVPISQQDDADYYTKQFSYNQKKVEQRQAKRKRASGKQRGRRKKRRKVRRKLKT